MKKTTKKEFELFTKECQYWLEKFSLKGWRIFFEHGEHPKQKNYAAWTETKYTDRTATLGLGLDYHGVEEREFNIHRDAFHEVCELFLNDIVVIGKMDISPMQLDELIKCVHSVIRTLENVVWEPDYLKRRGK